MIVHGDNLEVLRRRGDEAALVYMDPPFFSQRNYGAFDDRWASLDEYLESVVACAIEAWRLLSDHGSLVVHVDPRASHYLKVDIDRWIGRDHFRNEIVWRYRRWPTPQRRFQPMHDVLLWYSRDDEPTWNQLFEPLAPSTVASSGTGKQRAVVDGEGKRVRTSTEDAPSPGAAMSDVWDIPIVAPSGKERTGYPTQKPVALLERLVLALTNPGDLVLDPYVGSGTTGVAALKHGRRFLGIDQNEEACAIAAARLDQVQGPLFAQGAQR